MSLFNALTNVVQAGIAVAVSPVAVVADIVSLPSTAYDGKKPFGWTAAMFRAAGACIEEATKPSQEK